MNVDWDTNWAPTIVSIVVTSLFWLLGILLQRKLSKREKPPSENIEAISPQGTTSKFMGVKTYSRRIDEIDASGGKKSTEEIFQFESSEEGSSTVKTEDIDIEVSKSQKSP
jgi:hypothetical protein